MEITDIQKKVLAKAMTEISDRGIDFLVDNVNNDMDEAKKYKDEINNLIDLLGVEISKIDDYQVNFYHTDK